MSLFGRYSSVIVRNFVFFCNFFGFFYKLWHFLADRLLWFWGILDNLWHFWLIFYCNFEVFWMGVWIQTVERVISPNLQYKNMTFFAGILLWFWGFLTNSDIFGRYYIVNLRVFLPGGGAHDNHHQI